MKSRLHQKQKQKKEGAKKKKRRETKTHLKFGHKNSSSPVTRPRSDTSRIQKAAEVVVAYE